MALLSPALTLNSRDFPGFAELSKRARAPIPVSRVSVRALQGEAGRWPCHCPWPVVIPAGEGRKLMNQLGTSLELLLSLLSPMLISDVLNR